MGPGKVVIILAGRSSGKKALVVNSSNEPDYSSHYKKPFNQALVLGLAKNPRKISKTHTTRTHTKNSSKPKRFFKKYINLKHLMPTRYEIPLSESFTRDSTCDTCVQIGACITCVLQVYHKRENNWFFKK